MRVICLALGVSLAASLTATPPSSTEQDPVSLLAEARAAMGGAAIDAVATLSVSGSETQDIGQIVTSRSIEIHYQRPDKFVRTARASHHHPAGGFTVTTQKGFNGPLRIDSITAPGAPMPVFIPAPEPKTPEAKQAREELQMREQRLEFARLMIPLFAGSPDAYPVTFRWDGAAIVIKGLDDTEMRLFLDPVTHLPARLEWMDQPIVMFSTTRTVTTNSRGGVVSESSLPGAPPPPPPSSQVLWSTTFEDYKTEAGITWPRRLRTSISGKRFEDVRLGKYKINPAIKPSVFEPRK
jgi:hypothetical protein